MPHRPRTTIKPDGGKFERNVLAILATGPKLASEIAEQLDGNSGVHHVACRLRWMRADNLIDSKLCARSTIWGVLGAFDDDKATDTPEEPDLATQAPSQRPGTRTMMTSIVTATKNTIETMPVTLPIEPWAQEAAQ